MTGTNCVCCNISWKRCHRHPLSHEYVRPRQHHHPSATKYHEHLQGPPGTWSTQTGSITDRVHHRQVPSGTESITGRVYQGQGPSQTGSITDRVQHGQGPSGTMSITGSFHPWQCLSGPTPVQCNGRRVVKPAAVQ